MTTLADAIETFTAPKEPTDLYRLPSGDWISVYSVSAARVSKKASRQTGELSAIAHVNADSSWYSVPFEHADDAQRFLDALIEYRNHLHKPRERSMTRNEALGLIADLKSRDTAS